ncbi:MAG: hypothetical protein ABH896_03845 [Candidatus Jacksonbacteria bacterium]
MNKNKNLAFSADKQKLKEFQQLLHQTQKQIARMQGILSDIIGEQNTAEDDNASVLPMPRNRIKKEKNTEHFHAEKYPTGEEIIEGVFDGFQMIGPDGAKYQIPENYASKSKLIEGDLLKLTITPQGRFIYKQIGPTERETKKGILQYQDKEDQYYATTMQGVNYKILKASVTYYKGETGDEVIVLTPKGGGSQWAALDNIVRELEETEKAEEIEATEPKEELAGSKDVISQLEERDQLEEI